MNAPSKAFGRVIPRQGCVQVYEYIQRGLVKPAAHFQRKSSAEKCTAKVPDEKRMAAGLLWALFLVGWKIKFQCSVQAKRLPRRRRPANQLPCVKIFNTSTQRRVATQPDRQPHSSAPTYRGIAIPKVAPSKHTEMKCINKAHAESGQDTDSVSVVHSQKKEWVKSKRTLNSDLRRI